MFLAWLGGRPVFVEVTLKSDIRELVNDINRKAKFIAENNVPCDLIIYVTMASQLKGFMRYETTPPAYIVGARDLLNLENVVRSIFKERGIIS